MSITQWLLLFLSFSLWGQENSQNSPLADLPQIFSKAREVLITEGKTPPKILESDVVEYLQQHPEKTQVAKDLLLKELNDQAISKNVDPTKHVRLMPIPGTDGYSELQIYFNHPHYQGKLYSKKILNKRGSKNETNLIKVWGNFLKLAEKEIILNVFDFDLNVIADILVEKALQGVSVQVGIDKAVYEARPEVKNLIDRLMANKVIVTLVNSVQLNHQKITAIDWSIPEKARALFSSGNLTRSCLNPGGDLDRMDIDKSVPNANHIITLKSWVLANLVQNELTKTLTLKLRGQSYPFNGSYQVTGPGVKADTLEAYPNPSIIISFTPGGGTATEVDAKGKSKLVSSINKNLIAQIIKQETGFIRMLQFAYSSKDVEQALLFRAQQDFQTKRKFDFMSVGDTPFSVAEWSKFLFMSGLKLQKTVKEDDEKHPMIKKYVLDSENPWVKGLSTYQLKQVQSKVFIAPAIYAESSAVVDGKSSKVSAKIHHKVLATPHFAILGTSFNFSEGAENNNEQLLIIRDDQLPLLVDGVVRYFANQGKKTTVLKETQNRNQRYAKGEDVNEADPGDLESTLQNQKIVEQIKDTVLSVIKLHF